MGVDKIGECMAWKFSFTTVDLNQLPDAQTLRLGDEQDEQEEDDPFSAKLMTFDVSAVILTHI